MNVETCSAWLLAATKDRRFAIGEFEMLHIVLGRQRFFSVPRTPDYCCFVFLWQGQIVPVFDLGIYLDNSEKEAVYSNLQERYVCIVKYRTPDNNVNHGALHLSELPVRISVSDDQQCDLPDKSLTEISHSCFLEAESGPVPVLDLTKIFCNPPR